MTDQMNIQITPLSMLAAVLFNADKVQKTMVTPHDSDKEMEIASPVVDIRYIDDGVVCLLPLEKIMHFALNAYAMEFRVIRPNGDMTDERAMGVITFEKREESSLLSAEGKPVAPSNGVMQKALETLKVLK